MLMTEVLLCVKSGPLMCVRAHVCSPCVYWLCMCMACLPMERAAITRAPSVYLHAVGLEFVCVSLVSPESPSLSSFPTSLSSPSQVASGTELSPREPESHLRSGWGS